MNNKISNNIKFNKIQGHIDKVRYSIYLEDDKEYDRLNSLLRQQYGKPKVIMQKKYNNTSRGNLYGKTKIWLSYPDERRWSWIDFYPEEYSIDEMLSILNEFPILDDYDHKLQNISRTEIAFDLELGKVKQNTAELLAEYLSVILIPNIPKFNFQYTIKSKENKICNDGAQNGTTTYYWKSHERGSILKGFLPRVNPNAPSCKLYCKKLRGYWYIRFETTLTAKKIEQLFPELKKLTPNKSSLMFKKLIKKKFEYFYQFGEALYVDFMRDSVKYRPKYLDLKELWKHGSKETAVVNQVYIMRVYARFLISKVMRNKLSKDYISYMPYNYVEKIIKYILKSGNTHWLQMRLLLRAEKLGSVGIEKNENQANRDKRMEGMGAAVATECDPFPIF